MKVTRLITGLPSHLLKGLAVVAIVLAGQATTAQAQTDYTEIRAAKEALATAAKALSEAAGGRAQLAALGKAVSAHEVALAAYRDGLRNMATRESRLTRSIDADRKKLEDLLSALQSLSQAPRSALLAFPGGPVGAARGAGLMSEISPYLQERITEFSDRLAALRQLRSEQEAARIEVRGALAALQDLRAKTAEAVRRNRRRDLAPRSELKAQAEAAARQAANIDELAATLEGAALTDTGILITFTEAKG
ncbi:MAG: hypothetical protein AAF439_16555, partial [Pseudomonadota bacterium]